MVEGEEITATGVAVDRIRRSIGIVYQAFTLFPHMAVLRNVTLAPREVLRMDRRGAEERALRLLQRFGLLDKEDEYPVRLSGGQQQRTAIARARAMRPGVTLLDEVTSALDPELVAEVLGVIRELAADGMTMLIATYEMGFARDIADRVCFLEGAGSSNRARPAGSSTPRRTPAPAGFYSASSPRAACRAGLDPCGVRNKGGVAGAGKGGPSRD